MASVSKRIFIGGLSKEVTEKELTERFQKFGEIQNLEIRRKDSVDGHQEHCFAHANYSGTELNFQRILSTYNNTRWKGKTMKIALAEESFVQRLERERNETSVEQLVKIPKKQKQAQRLLEKRQLNFEKAGVDNFVMKKAVPGTAVEGEKKYIVGKFGRVLPIVYIRRKDKQKVMKYDPSKYTHHLKSIRDDETQAENEISNLSWKLEEKTKEKRKFRGNSYQSKEMLYVRAQDNFNGHEEKMTRKRTQSKGEKGKDIRTETQEIISFDDDFTENNSSKSIMRHEYTSGSDDEDNLITELRNRKSRSYDRKQICSQDTTISSLFGNRKIGLKQRRMESSGSDSDSIDYETMDVDEGKVSPNKVSTRNDELNLSEVTIATNSVQGSNDELVKATQRTINQTTQITKKDSAFDLLILDKSLIENETEDKIKTPVRSGAKIKKQDVPEFKGLGMLKRTRNTELQVQPLGGKPLSHNSSAKSNSVNLYDQSKGNEMIGQNRIGLENEIEDLNNLSSIDTSEVDSSENEADDYGEKLAAAEKYIKANNNTSLDNSQSGGSQNVSTSHKTITKQKTASEEDSFVLQNEINFEERLNQFAATLKRDLKSSQSESHTDKAKLSNEKRLQALQDRQNEHRKQRSTLKNAFSALDSKGEGKTGTHVRFDSDSDENSADEMEEDGQSVSKQEPSEKANKGLALFSDEDEADENSEDEDRFLIKPQFEGEAGSKLLKLQDRFGGDSRFKLDARFLDDSKVDEETEGDVEIMNKLPIDDETTDMELAKEKAQSLAVLANVLNKPLMAPQKEHLRGTFKHIPRFDPSSKEHQKYIKKSEPTTDNSTESVPQKKEIPLPPEVSKDKFFEIQGNLKNAFGGENTQEGEKPFSFFGNDDEDGDDLNGEKYTYNSNTISEKGSSLFGKSQFKLPYDSSDSEEGDEGGDEDATSQLQSQEDQEQRVAAENQVNKGKTSFFFTSDDARLEAGPLSFYRSEDDATISEWWRKMTSELQVGTKKRHRKAVHDGWKLKKKRRKGK